MKIETRVWTLDELILANKVKLGRGDIISKKDIASFPGEYPIYSSAREKNGTFGFYGKYMFDEELITWSIDGGGRLFYRPRHKFSVTNVGGTLRILDTDFLDCRYLHLVLTHLHSKIGFDWVYKAHPSVIRMVYNEIPIPSLEKQREIVEKLDDAFAEIDLLQENLGRGSDKCNQLSQSLLNSTFRPLEDSEAVRNPALSQEIDLQMVPLKDLCIVFGDGDWIESKDQSESGIRLIQTGNIGKGVFKDRIEKSRWISEETFKRLRCTEIREGDVLISRLPDPVGRACLIPALEHKAITAVDCSIVRFNENRILPKFFVYYSQAPAYGSAIGPLISGATRQRISREKLGTIEIPLRSLQKQREIVEKLDKSFAEIELLKAQIELEKEHAAALRQSLLSSTFLEREAVV